MDEPSETCIFDVIASDTVVASVIADLLWVNGVQGIEEIESPDASIVLRSSFGVEKGSTERILLGLLGGIEAVTWQLHTLDPTVADTWKQFARPIAISPDLIIVPSWIDEDFTDLRGRLIRIEPGATFGLGDHPTTRGSLRMLIKWLGSESSVLDVGCGSGILGITALAFGARSALGLDINPASVSVSQSNAAANHVEEKWNVLLDPIDTVEERFDIIVANILAPVLIELAENFIRHLEAEGTLIISGILRDSHDHVLRALEPLQVVDAIDIEGWVTLALRR